MSQKHLYKVALNYYEASWIAERGSFQTTVVGSPATTEGLVWLQLSGQDGSEALVPLFLDLWAYVGKCGQLVRICNKMKVPIKESRACFVQLRWCLRWTNSKSKACFCSGVMLASIMFMFSKMPKNINDLVGLSTLDDFTGALILLHRESIAVKCSCACQYQQVQPWKNHLTFEASVLLHNYAVLSSGLYQIDN